MDEGLVVGGVRAERGKRKIVKLPVTVDINGAPLEIVTHIVSGKKPGPVLTLLSMQHGNEWMTVLVLRQLLESLDLNELKGTILAVPVANQVAFATGTRCILDDSDSPDLNRAYGGEFAWMADQMARVITDELLKKSDYMVDYHISDWGSTMADISVGEDYSNPAIVKKCMDMAKAFGYPGLHILRVCSGFPGPRSGLGYAGQILGLPCIVAEIGGLGFGAEIEKRWLDQNVDGTKSLMRHLGMLEGKPTYAPRYLVTRNRWRISPTKAGYLEPLVGLDKQFTEVAKGQPLARLTSPYTFEELETLRSPGRGVIFYACRSYMVRPGGWAFGVTNMEDGKSGWFTKDQF